MIEWMLILIIASVEKMLEYIVNGDTIYIVFSA